MKVADAGLARHPYVCDGVFSRQNIPVKFCVTPK